MKKSFGAKPFLIPTPVWIIGSYDSENKPNIMAVAWGGICSSKPPCVNISIRKATYTYHNIMNKKAFTVNVPSQDFLWQADFTGIFSGKEVDKFSSTNLTPVKSVLVDAPYIKEFPLVAECKLIQTHEVGIHTMFIGEIVDVKADEHVLNDKGVIDWVKVKPFLYSPIDSKYYGSSGVIGDAYCVGERPVIYWSKK
ncbi:MAG: flavin reductase family protein [Candidatus Odinarchaeum yellowstonii]|jgi:flavin reductase (DIM6/NTAB) family NADH-FMN oxidoreductase RutF|uniref:Flavin reductase family protein n=1 Tax=Odinarchaeota yellowstonii (strain LCB_4) TaxID=1841599 RepID=A0AAF0D3A6_ODILC|nr:MAG: flavin reductase family protein [Candidatus Odinarchaeum yellowstonii]